MEVCMVDTAVTVMDTAAVVAIQVMVVDTVAVTVVDVHSL
jgi:hypothetical protein